MAYIYKPETYCNVFATKRYIVVMCVDSYHGLIVSTTGWHTFSAQPAPLAWLGENIRKSLLTSKHQRFEPEDWDQETFNLAASASRLFYDNFVKEIAKEFRCRSPQAVFSKAIGILISWPINGTEPIEILALNRKHGGMYEALANNGKNRHNIRQVQIEASNLEIEAAARAMLVESTICGKKVEL